jgi:outer membrane protein assembly factor BamB
MSRKVTVLLCFFVSATALADDWPQWNGPKGTGVVSESGVLDKIPAAGLKKLWSKPVSYGYSGPAAADGRIYVTDYNLRTGKIANNPGSRDKLTGSERIHCLDAKTGEQIWKHEYERDYAVSYGGGPRVVPTIHNGHVYAIGAEGNLTCLDAKTGDVKWSKDYAKDYGAKTPLWGHSASPCVYKDSLICLVGGEGSLVVAFDLKTGEEKWKTLSSKGKDGTGYCPPSIINHAGVDQLLVWSPETLYCLDPVTRDIHWQYELKAAYGMSILPPLLDGNMLFSSAEGHISLMLELSPEAPKAKELWRGNPRISFYAATASGVFTDGHLYGADLHTGTMTCSRASDGKRLWSTTLPTTGKEERKGPGQATAFMLKLGDTDNYLLFSETGHIISATMTPEGYNETGRFFAIEPTSAVWGRKLLWTYPALSDGKLLVRSDKEIVCYDVSAK